MPLWRAVLATIPVLRIVTAAAGPAARATAARIASADASDTSPASASAGTLTLLNPSIAACIARKTALKAWSIAVIVHLTCCLGGWLIAILFVFLLPYVSCAHLHAGCDVCNRRLRRSWLGAFCVWVRSHSGFYSSRQVFGAIAAYAGPKLLLEWPLVRHANSLPELMLSSYIVLLCSVGVPDSLPAIGYVTRLQWRWKQGRRGPHTGFISFSRADRRRPLGRFSYTAARTSLLSAAL